MKELTMAPVFLERNRVWRVYKGGMLFSDLMGDKKEDNNYPEEWIASTVKAMNKDSGNEKEGLSIVEGTDITLKELIEAYPEEMLGKRKNLGVLVKYLDSAIRLPLQAHPDKAFSKKYFDSEYGKTEMWLILQTRENANICFGFKEELTEEEFSELIERSKTEKDIMGDYLNRVPVKPGDVFLIPAKAVHAIGAGCCILEVQEPTDFTIQPEYWCGDYKLDESEMYINLEKKDALKCFDFSICGEECISLSKKEPKTEEENDRWKKETLISYADTPCFRVNRYTVYKDAALPEGPAIYIVASGHGKIGGRDYSREIKKGDYFMMPYNAAGKFRVENTGDGNMEVIECLPSAME